MIRWQLIPDSPPGSTFYNGEDSETGRRYFVCSFSIEDQGFPPGSLGYDGTTSLRGTVIRLTREKAEAMFKEAAKS